MLSSCNLPPGALFILPSNEILEDVVEGQILHIHMSDTIPRSDKLHLLWTKILNRHQPFSSAHLLPNQSRRGLVLRIAVVLQHRPNALSANKQFVDGRMHKQLPLVQQRDAVGNTLDVTEGMRRKQHRSPPF